MGTSDQTPREKLPRPTNVQSLRRTLGLFAYYAKWIPDFSSKIQPSEEFPLSTQAENALKAVKKELEVASLNPIDEAMPFVVECDATLNQAGRPVAFMSRTLQDSELHYPAVEKEATANIEPVRKWSDFLLRREFHLITDQRSVAFMLDKRKRTKIKNNKIQGWRLELASYGYTIQYRPGRENVGPDTLTRATCASMTNSLSKLSDIHDRLCHSGVTRLLHFVRTKNLPYSTYDIKKLCHSCRICAELKPQFYRPQPNCPNRSCERVHSSVSAPRPLMWVGTHTFLCCCLGVECPILPRVCAGSGGFPSCFAESKKNS